MGKVQLKVWPWAVTHLHYGRSEPRHHRKKQIIRENEFEMYGKLEYYRSRLSLIYYL